MTKNEYRDYLLKQKRFYKLTNIVDGLGFSLSAFSKFLAGDDWQMSAEKLSIISKCLDCDIEEKVKNAKESIAIK